MCSFETAAAGALSLIKLLDLENLKLLKKAPSELHVLEHLKHGVKHGQHDHVALHQPASVQGCSPRIRDYLYC